MSAGRRIALALSSETVSDERDEIDNSDTLVLLIASIDTVVSTLTRVSVRDARDSARDACVCHLTAEPLLARARVIARLSGPR